MNIKHVIKSVVRRAGFDLRRLSVDSNSYAQLLAALDHFKIDLIFDVGANQGQFSSELRSVGFSGKLVSFEPLAEPYNKLAHLAADDSQWIVHERAAIGEFDGYTEINVAGNSVSSSILPMLDSHVAAAEQSSYIGKESAPIFRIDTVAPPYMANSTRSLLKIDAQGYEWQVLDGASEIMPRLGGIMCELSLVPLYEDQRLWEDVIERLREQGFTLWALQNGFSDQRNGRSLQLDGIFFRCE